MSQQARILLVEDEIDFLEFYVEELEEEQTYTYEIDTARNLDKAKVHIQQHKYSVIVTDVRLQTNDDGGMTILKLAKSIDPDTQVVLFTGFAGQDARQLAIELGATDYLTKPIDFELMREKVRRCADIYQKRKDMRGPRNLPTPETLVYASQVMKDVDKLALKLAKEDHDVFITGERGTGKGIIAEGIHFASGRKDAGFEILNCGSMSERTLEQILFGKYDESTDERAIGVLERLTGGTLVLDRISSLSLQLQEQLYDTISTGNLSPAGLNTDISLVLRLILIDESDLESQLRQGLFSQQLKHYIDKHADMLVVPPLRERVDETYQDVLTLSTHFITSYGSTKFANQEMPRLSPQVEMLFKLYPFPGNVRELQQIIISALRQVEGDKIEESHLPEHIRSYGIRPGLGVNEADDVAILCPHGDFYCQQIKTIANAHADLKGVWFDMEHDELHTDLRDKLKRFGLSILPREHADSLQTIMCSTCIPIQSCHFAVVDVTHATHRTFHDLGLLGALGVPTLKLLHDGASASSDIDTQTYVTYKSETEIVSIVDDWLKLHVLHGTDY